MISYARQVSCFRSSRSLLYAGVCKQNFFCYAILGATAIFHHVLLYWSWLGLGSELLAGVTPPLLPVVCLLCTVCSPARAWINELLAKITAPELARDVAGAEALLARHAEYQAELQTRQDAVDAVSGY